MAACHRRTRRPADPNAFGPAATFALWTYRLVMVGSTLWELLKERLQ